MVIAKNARHPNAARLFCEFMLSEQVANEILSREAFYPARIDVKAGDLPTISRAMHVPDQLAARFRNEVVSKWQDWLGLSNR